MNPDEKYIVIKRSEFQRLTAQALDGASAGPISSMLHEVEHLALGDATVVRAHDIFAGPVLHTYANAVQTAIEVIQGVSSGDTLWVKELEVVRDYFHDRAVEATEYQRKRFPKAP